MTPCSFAFSKTKPIPGDWRCSATDLAMPFWHVLAPGSRQGEIKKLVAGIAADNFMLTADLGEACLLVIKTYGKGKGEKTLFSLLRKSAECDEAANVLSRYDFKSDELMAHASLQAAKELLERSVGDVFINKGLFNNYFLKERLSKSLSERGRSLSREASGLFSRIEPCLASDPVSASGILKALGFDARQRRSGAYPEYELESGGERLNVCCVVAAVDCLDFRTADMAAPSYQAVARLRDYDWAILSNGPVWRIYGRRAASESTSYFELNLEGISDASDPRLPYLAAIFSAQSFVLKGGTADIDLIYEGGVIHARGLEEDLREKVFDEQLFLNLVRSALVFDRSKRYSEAELEQGKRRALKLLYRLLFILCRGQRADAPAQ